MRHTKSGDNYLDTHRRRIEMGTISLIKIPFKWRTLTPLPRLSPQPYMGVDQLVDRLVLASSLFCHADSVRHQQP